MSFNVGKDGAMNGRKCEWHNKRHPPAQTPGRGLSGTRTVTSASTGIDTCLNRRDRLGLEEWSFLSGSMKICAAGTKGMVIKCVEGIYLRAGAAKTEV